jgi:hypothetical protein
MQGWKIHEQQIRMLERKPDVPDARRTEADLKRLPEADAARSAKRDTRQSEFPVSHRGLHQESDHNKHNDPAQGAPKHDGSADKQ